MTYSSNPIPTERDCKNKIIGIGAMVKDILMAILFTALFSGLTLLLVRLM